MAEARSLTSPLTLRITGAEVVRSQLTVEDLRALRSRSEGDVKCPNVYCLGGYCGAPLLSHAAVADRRP